MIKKLNPEIQSKKIKKEQEKEKKDKKNGHAKSVMKRIKNENGSITTIGSLSEFMMFLR